MSIETAKPCSRWSWRRPRFWLAATAAIVLLAIATGWHCSYHLAWHFGFPESLKEKIRPVPVATMPVTGPTPGWYRCQIGPISIRLPPDIVEQQRRSDAGSVTFESESRLVTVVIPDDSSTLIRDTETLARQQFPHFVSMEHLWADAYTKDAREFRWSMSPRGVRQFTVWMVTAAMNDSTVTSVETRFDQNVEGLLKFRSDGSAQFSWGSADKTSLAWIIFKSKNGPVEPNWVREVCESLKVTSPVPQRWSKDEIRQILDAMDAVPEE